MSCPICEKRKAKRWCPAKGEKICAVCCGTEREVTIDCPSDCPYLVAARRYEEEHRKRLSPDELPYPDVEIPAEVLADRQAILADLSFAILWFAKENAGLVDQDVLVALGALAETYRTLAAGIYYEKPPDAALPHALYLQLGEAVQELKQEEMQRAGFTALKDTDVFYLLVFLLRVGRHQTNGRPRARAFLGFLQARFPMVSEVQQADSRIITP
jgi:hypothetical protein